MELLLPFLIGGFFGCGVYMLLRRSFVKLVIGLALLSHAANLLIFACGGLTRYHAPILGEDNSLGAVYANPLPQALILTAIVISFGVLAFAIVLLYKQYQVGHKEDTEAMTATDR